jgi:hypothetical protein
VLEDVTGDEEVLGVVRWGCRFVWDCCYFHFGCVAAFLLASMVSKYLLVVFTADQVSRE